MKNYPASVFSIIFLLVFFLVSCGKTEKKPVNPDFYPVNIEFAKIQIDIPNSYYELDLKQFFEETDVKEPIDPIILQQFATLRNHPYPSSCFVDSLDFFNRIIFMGGEYVKLNKPVADQYISLVDKNLEREWTPLGVKFKKIDNKFFRGEKIEIIKIKYQFELLGIPAYMTQYLISANFKTFSIMVYNTDGKDFEEQVRTLRFIK